jgi:hypothetical protein
MLKVKSSNKRKLKANLSLGLREPMIKPPEHQRTTTEQLLLVHKTSRVDNEIPEVSQLPPYIALSRLKSGSGNRYGLERIMSRLVLGRIIAHYHFKEPTGEIIHKTIAALIECAAFQKEGDDMSISQEDAIDVVLSLNAIDQMQSEISSDDYTIAFMRFVQYSKAVKSISFTEENLLPWEDFKTQQGWL